MTDNYLETKNAILEDLLLKGIDFDLAVNTINSSNDMFQIYQILGIQIPENFQLQMEGIPPFGLNLPGGPPEMPQYQPFMPALSSTNLKQSNLSFTPPGPPGHSGPSGPPGRPGLPVPPGSLNLPGLPKTSSAKVAVETISPNPFNKTTHKSLFPIIPNLKTPPNTIPNQEETKIQRKISQLDENTEQLSSQSYGKKSDSSLLASKNDLLSTTLEAINLDSFKEKPINLMYQDFDANFSYGFAHEGFAENFEDDAFEDSEEIDFDFDSPETIPMVRVDFSASAHGHLNVFKYFSRMFERENKEVVLEQAPMIRFCYENYLK